MQLLEKKNMYVEGRTGGGVSVTVHAGWKIDESRIFKFCFEALHVSREIRVSQITKNIFLKSSFTVNEMIWLHITKIPLYDPLRTPSSIQLLPFTVGFYSPCPQSSPLNCGPQAVYHVWGGIFSVIVSQVWELLTGRFGKAWNRSFVTLTYGGNGGFNKSILIFYAFPPGNSGILLQNITGYVF